jgi:hypothetical protein
VSTVMKSCFAIRWHASASWDVDVIGWFEAVRTESTFIGGV